VSGKTGKGKKVTLNGKRITGSVAGTRVRLLCCVLP
tara:strand:- start:2956 stop:3063 length:108 start_codon:yes stop_codon:yes gene_type:complete